MRIMHCLRAPVGGLFRHVLDLAGEQAARGHDVGIIADSNAEDALTGAKFAMLAPSLTLGIARTPMSRQPGLGDFNAYRSVLAHAAPLDLDVLHGHGAKGGAYARLTARALKRRSQNVKAFYTPHGGSLNYKPGSLQARVFLKGEKLLERMTAGLIFESDFAARVYESRIGFDHAPYRVIHNGVQPSDFSERVLSPDARDILYIGELRAIKGVDTLLNALAQLNIDRPVTATIVGSGPDAEKLKAQAAGLGLAEKVVFTGALPASKGFALGRIMAVPSLAESFPYVVLEAAAAGIALVSTSVGGIPEIVAGTDTELIQAGDAQALARALSFALDNPQAAQAKAARLKANVGTKFTVAAMTTAVLDFYALTKR